ncbi:response regulator [Flavobacterium sp.]|uniref:response regulator transcription factor n=1 Tax=Flavobacterium sp. TaxID=239 RepID=UPI0035B1E0F5
MKKSIVIVDDHILIAKALSAIIANFNNFEVLYECENGKELINRFEQNRKVPDIVLLDVSMPVMDGFETASWLKENYPDILVMALSMQDDETSVIKMVQNGASGYLLKNTHPSELEKALTTLIDNGYFYPDWAAKKIFKNIGSSAKKDDDKVHITDREKEFLKYVTTEMSYKEIGEKMFCSPRTVESYRDSLFEKLELKTRVGLAVYAIKNGLG